MIESFKIGPLEISPFGIMIAIAFLASYWQLARSFVKRGIGDKDEAYNVVFAAAIGGIIGAKVYYAVLIGDWNVLFERAGFVWYGGFIGGALAVYVYLKKRNIPILESFDEIMVALALGYGIGRIGCFLVGDDYGIPSNLPWAVAFPHGVPPSTAYYLDREFGIKLTGVSGDTLIRVHPTQLYETLVAFSIYLFALYLLPNLPKGAKGSIVLMLLGFERFFVEFLRAKDDRFFGYITLAQVISVIVIGVAFVLLIWIMQKERKIQNK